jgi:hypothetical protein
MKCSLEINQGGVMATKGLDMKLIKDIQRLKRLKFTKRRVSRVLKIHRKTVARYWGDEPLSPAEEQTIENKIEAVETAAERSWADNVDWEKVRSEVLAGVTLSVIHEEQGEKVPVGYSAFWKQLQKRAPCLAATMVRIFAPGVRTEIDYCDGIDLIDLGTGEVIKTELFVGVLCNSRYTFAEFTLSQKSEDFLESHVRMFEFFGGLTQVVSPDNLKSAVTRAHRYDPVLNPAYTRAAEYYGFAVVPARVRTPRDKALVERTIQIFQRWFFFKVRNQRFTSLVELNKCLRENLALFHQKKHRIFGRTRLEMFEQEREHLIRLPEVPYQVATYLRANLGRDCHLRAGENFYSAPHRLRGLALDVWKTARTVEIYHQAERVALHPRYKTNAKFITDPSHYPPAHQAYLEEDVVRIKERALKVGPETSKLITELFSGPYPLQHLQRCQGIVALSWRYSAVALEQAAIVANRFNQKTIHYLERVIKQGNHRKEVQPITREFNPHLRGIGKMYH